jgi:hypothetical protein
MARRTPCGGVRLDQVGSSLMSSLVIAIFNNQFAATSAFDKLMARGLSRCEGVVRCDESVSGCAASASAPTTVVSRVSHLGKREGARSTVRIPGALPRPDELGFAVLAVEIHNDDALAEVVDVMHGLDALDVHIQPGEMLQENDASIWPDQGMGNSTDVDRAIQASRAGRPRVH